MSQPHLPESEQGLPLRTVVHAVYALFAIGIISMGVFGASIIAAVVLAYYKRGDVAGTIYASHLDWIIKTFWWGLLWLAISAVLTMIFIGWITGIIALVWIIFRVIKGWLSHFSGQSPELE
ncbi:hypothetical protein L1889_03495 [Paenalcaligenes niemegkensis]|uniref:DUF4870 family protein n=1 Tax=Paenalcaligenes niemegkensis TaxID=2895469 RepID=UPI001EE93282|nr:hypothetical protein [Paenalcaligenes niemegkensis]MCQ9615878.1 hypothetical protein [Paenalcaligenes niemegkensis]